MLKNKIVLVTGAASGIGRAVALTAAREGASVVVSDMDETGAEETAGLVREQGAEALVVCADVGDPADATHLVERCCAHFGRLDIACNLTGPGGAQGVRYQIEAMLRTAGGGAIVNVAHAAPCPSDLRHEAQRREVRHLLRHSALAGNDTPPGVRINTVAHGLIARGTVPTLFSPTARNDTDRVAELVAWLASDRAAGITGAFYPLETTETASA